MSISVIKQYSVFLVNQPGELRDFANLFYEQNVNIIAFSQDVRYDAAVVRVALDNDNDEISHAITKAGFTCVRTDAIALKVPNKIGILKNLTEALAAVKINITTIYGTVSEVGNSYIVLVVNDIDKAVEVLKQTDLNH